VRIPNQNPIFCETGDRFEVRTFSPMVAILPNGTMAGKLLEREIPVFPEKTPIEISQVSEKKRIDLKTILTTVPIPLISSTRARRL
jgi:hypothetical protein